MGWKRGQGGSKFKPGMLRLLLLACVSCAVHQATASVANTSVSTFVRILKPKATIRTGTDAWNEFESSFQKNAATALGTPASRIIVKKVSEGNPMKPSVHQFGDRRRRTTDAYEGETLLVRFDIASGSPSSQTIFS